MVQKKIIELIQENRHKKKPLISYEVFPHPDLRIEDFVDDKILPAFISIVWRPDVHFDLKFINDTNVNTISAIKLAERIAEAGHTVLLHLTCVNMSKTTLKYILDHVKKYSIQNLFLLQGEGFVRPCEDGFSHVDEMIKYIRQNYNDYFCISVAGFLKGHPDSKNFTDYMNFFKNKINEGVDFIITQMFYEPTDFINFVNMCRSQGIDIPILPGIPLFPSYRQLLGMIELTKSPVPKVLMDQLDIVRHDDELFQSTLNKFMFDMIQQLLKQQHIIHGIHWFSFNKSKNILNILKSMKIYH